LEEPYDEEGPDGLGRNENATQPVRRFQWWGWLSTIGGYISGNGYVWPFRADWRNHLDTQGSRDMARLNAFIVSIPWYSLVPSGLGGMRTLITAGGSNLDADDVAASATPQGTLLVAYIPPDHSGSITVDMGAMGGPSRARWFDPTSGTYTSIGSGLVNSGTRAFTPPGNNSVGQKDWTLVLDTAGTAGSPSPPSTPTPTPTPTSTPTPTPGVIAIGETAVLSTADDGNGNLLVAQQATLPVTSVLQSMSFYVTNAAGRLRLGVYDASGPGGGPGNKIAETEEIRPVNGWNTGTTPPTVLPAGSYWLAYFPSSNSLAFVKNLDGAEGRYYSLRYGPLPSTFSTNPSSTQSHWSFYATLQP